MVLNSAVVWAAEQLVDVYVKLWGLRVHPSPCMCCCKAAAQTTSTGLLSTAVTMHAKKWAHCASFAAVCKGNMCIYMKLAYQ